MALLFFTFFVVSFIIITYNLYTHLLLVISNTPS